MRSPDNAPGDSRAIGALLAIEASNPSMYDGDEGSVAVVRDGVVTLERMRSGARHDDAIMGTIDAACRRAGVQPADIRRIAVSLGPGGYTGLRIAVTTAKLLAETLGTEVIGVPTAAAIAEGFVADHPTDASLPFVVLLASKRETVWAQAFIGTRAMSPGALVDASGLDGIIRACGAGVALADGNLPEPLHDAAFGAGAKVVRPRLDAGLCALAAGSLGTMGVDALAPIYPREPEAVRKWREGV